MLAKGNYALNFLGGIKMNSNNLDTMEKNLRSIAKRYENVKYSIGLAVLFLMKGTSAFSEDNHIQEAERKKLMTKEQNL